MPRFVLQEHYARSRHFELGLERDAVLLSWAVPKGMPTDPGKNRLAVRVEDHALSHLEYEDPTPVEGGPEGAVRIGSYEAQKVSEEEVVVLLRGERLNGRYAIFRTRDENWLVHRVVQGACG